MDILIKGGRLLDPVNERDGLYALWIRDGKIWKVKEQNTDKEESDASGEDCRVVDASGCYVMPGLIDLHVHLRDPGFTYKDTGSPMYTIRRKCWASSTCFRPEP